ncbi:MAG: hypothetical protein ACI9LG_001456 [Moritella dasanensis]|jgi:hypothetical protein
MSSQFIQQEQGNVDLGLAQQQQKSAIQVRLLKGPLYRARHRDLWQWLERDQFQIREYFQHIGLYLLLDDAEGYAFLKQQDDSDEEEESGIPRLITRRSLTFAQTLLLVGLRKRLAEHDSEESAPRLTVSRDEMHQWLSPYFAEVSNQIKQRREFDALIKKVVEMGFISQLPNYPDDFEVQRILKAFVSAEQIIEFNQTLALHLQSNQREGES